MVKINNVLGEVKKGVQGEAVYQGRYGQQIRRTRQPKRAIPSQKQLEHRDLYRAALAWRKALSRANRRYLDGYCIANWVVDDYHIPLPWSRFALKLYLQHIGFVIVDKPTLAYTFIPDEGTEEQTQHDSILYIRTPLINRAGQRLTIAHRKVTNLAFVLSKYGSPTGSLTFEIRRVSDNSLIVSQVWGDISALTGSPVWREVVFDTPPTIDEEVRICAYYPGGNISNRLTFYYKTGDIKANEHFTTYQNTSWSDQTGNDAAYRYTYLDMEQGETVIDWSKSHKGLLHIRHPALLMGEHRRDGKLLEEWTTLSNLDEEYLTRQVGVDVFPGDELKFTTIAGLEYPFRVP